ncbi:tetratricopeptide repeat protein [Microcystis sp. LEGE 08355]|uniref:tetratricopeptide repeat protein n=1 Tax=Microcystis sp. LEGE 08355 TaxID=1828687 RepID=UPI00187E9FE4|nr:tetratricopeptide repeat protein [Microcystis sp. LEGE 08355]MBE9072284.1 tetratricopeptide repeat protein [Microcystis sp. LEGE 08355]
MDTSEKQSQRIAVAISAINKGELNAVIPDVSRVHAWLTNPELGNCQSNGPKPLHECQSQIEFLQYFLPKIQKWNNQNQLIFYFSGHGDIRREEYCLKLGINDSDWFPFSNLTNYLSINKVNRAILILDACHSGAVTKGIRSLEPLVLELEKSNQKLSKGIVIIASCQETQVSRETNEGNYGIFTKFLCEGIENGMDGNSNKPYIYVGDIVNYIKEKIERDPIYSQFDQRPQFKVINAASDIWIAKNKHILQDKSKENEQSNRVTSSEELKFLYEQIHPNRHPCTEASLDKIDLELIKKYAKKMELSEEDQNNLEKIVDELKLYSPIYHEGKQYLHKAAVLCFHQNPERIYPQCKSTFVDRTRGKTAFERYDIHGSLIHQIEKLVERVKQATKKISFINKKGMRQEIDDIDLEVAREIISNAIAHRNYQLNSHVQVIITPEALEVKSPGNFPDNTSWEELIKESTPVSIPIDAAIAQYLSQLSGYEGIGQGFTLFKQYIENNGLDSLTFQELSGKYICVSLLRRNEFSNEILENNIAIPTYIDFNNVIGDKVMGDKITANIPNNLYRVRTGAVNFVGREDAMTQLHHQLQQQERIAITAVVTGMGGLGKTELALQYALHHQKNSTYPGGICWIGVQAETVGVQLLDFAKSQLGLFPPEDLNLRGQLDYCWARWQPPGDVLLILDDVHQYKEIQDYLPPQEQRFKVLITTRQQSLAASFEQLRLPVLSESAALALLESLIGASRLQAELEVGKGLCAWLGYLPLGLELVGRFLKQRTNWTLARMQQQLIDTGLQLSALQNPSADMTAQRGVEAVFELSWEELNPPARHLGCFLSLFALAPIPWRLVVERCLSAEDEDELEEIREEQLLNLNLLQAVEGEVYQFHPLVRQFFQAKLALREDADELKSSFCRGMVEEAKTIPQTSTKEQVEAVALSIPHLAESATALEQWLEEEDLIPSLGGLGNFYYGQGLYEQAKLWYQQCLEVTLRRLGKEHPDVATSLNNLALLYESQGRYAEAEPLYLQALGLYKRLLGDNHPNVATSLNNLANLYESEGNYAEAEPLYLQAIELCKRLLGESDPNVATSLNNLAFLYYSQGRYTEAEPLYLEALDLRKRLLGDNHPDVASSLNNLAELYHSQGRYTEAEPLHLEALDLRKRLLGDNHPSVAASLNNLAALYQSQGRYTEAEPLYLQALDLRKRLLGDNHPSVATSLNNLAELYQSQGRYTEAEPLYLEALDLDKRLLGDNHPDVATSLNNLAELYRSQGRYTEAEPLYLQALDLRKRLLGDNHPDVANSLNNLAALYQSQGRYTEAEPLYLEALDLRKRLLGNNHPDVARSLNNLARLYNSQGKYEEAEPLYLQALAIAEQALGENHPTTVRIRENLESLP